MIAGHVFIAEAASLCVRLSSGEVLSSGVYNTRSRTAMAASLFHPVIAGWFEEKFSQPSEVQLQGWPAIASGQDVLLTAPTGSGKTLTAFLIAIDRLFRQALTGHLPERIEVVYISPLKALANDIQKNLEQPLAEIYQQAFAAGHLLAEIRAVVRSGDTRPAERQAHLRHPPQILVTTPESFYLALTSPRFLRCLGGVETVIVDEIHALAPNKRGAHLALSLERLDHEVRRQGHPRPQRIGLSATVQPLELMARFLSGATAQITASPHTAPRSTQRTCQIVAIPPGRQLDLAIEKPPGELGAIATNEQWEERYDRLAELAREHRATLVFVSTRRLAERVAHRLRERLGEGNVAAHHGSLSRQIRLAAETRFRAGQLPVMVATASLELGLDIGHVDLVCQLGSPRNLGAAWQRIGRSGHSVPGKSMAGRSLTPKGRFLVTTRDDLVECAALIASLRAGELETLWIPPWPRDILAQQMVATVAGAAGGSSQLPAVAGSMAAWEEDELWELFRRAQPYADLPRREFDRVLEILCEGIATRRGRRGALLHRDGRHRKLRPRRGARLAAVTGGGAIPDASLFTVIAQPEGAVVGTLDEDFAVESSAGDIFLLGTTSWRVKGLETGKVLVEDAAGAAPTIPFWLGEAPGRSPELSSGVAQFRRRTLERLDRDGASAALQWLEQDCGLEPNGAGQLLQHLSEGRRALGVLPDARHFVAERFFDPSGGMQLVIHAPLGSRINKAWGMALRKRFCRGFDFELQAAAGENGLVLSLSEQHSFPLETIFTLLPARQAREILTQAILQSPLFPTRWRWNLGRGLALARWSGGHKIPPQLLRMRAEDLLAAVFPAAVGCQDNHDGDLEVPDHPYVAETLRDCLEEALDATRLEQTLGAMERGEIRLTAIDTPAPSVFAHELLNLAPYGFLDDAPLEERRARAVSLRQTLPPELGAGMLDAAAIAAVQQEAWPELADAEEFHDLLLSLIWLPDETAAVWQDWIEQLSAQGRVLSGIMTAPDGREHKGWLAWERQAAARALGIQAAPADVQTSGTSAEAGMDLEIAWADLLRGWAEITGPFTVAEMAARLGAPAGAIESASLRLENDGVLLRGFFRARLNPAGPELEFCERRLLARIHRRTLHRLRAEIEPVTPAVLLRFLFRWQHVAPGTRLHGLQGLVQVLAQLQGFEAAAAAWESDILPARLADYDPAWLDQLCLGGEIAWARLSPPTGGVRETHARKRVLPTRISPVTFFARAQAASVLARAGWPYDGIALSAAARRVLAVLESRGACFFADLAARLGVAPDAGAETDAASADGPLMKSELEQALWELSAAGLVTADGFDNLRALFDARRRGGVGRAKAARPRHSSGRWSRLADLAPELAAAKSALPEDAPTRAAQAQKNAEMQARQLLARYGVIFKTLLERESAAFAALSWRDLLLACRRLEARGEIRGGRFVSGFTGEQFALPEAVEALRAVRKLPPLSSPLRMGAHDPLNLAGILTSEEKIPAQPGQYFEYLQP